MPKVIVCYLIVNILCLLYILKLWSLNDDIQDMRREILAKKALLSNKHMLKYIQNMVKTAYYRAKFHHRWDNISLIQTHYDIESFCENLFKQSNDSWQEYQSRCIDMIDDIKTMIRNYHQDGRYKQTAECMLTYLSLCEVNILSCELDLGDLPISEIGPRFNRLFQHFLYIIPYTEKEERSCTPQEMVAALRQKNTNVPQTEEWYQELQDDLELLQKYYRNCSFRMNGMILLPEEMYYNGVLL